jgi:hypothetical protein
MFNFSQTSVEFPGAVRLTQATTKNIPVAGAAHAVHHRNLSRRRHRDH